MHEKQNYICGAHPHGVYPLGLLHAIYTEDAFKVLEKIKITILGSTMLFFLPLIRDLMMKYYLFCFFCYFTVLSYNNLPGIF